MAYPYRGNDTAWRWLPQPLYYRLQRRASGLGLLLALLLALAATLWLATALSWALALLGGLLLGAAAFGLGWLATLRWTRLTRHQQRQWWSASLRAARLTRRMLGAGAYRQLCRTGHIRVSSALHPGRIYLVPRRTSPSGARVLVEERGQVIGGLCLRPREPLPDPEEAVAHVLLLRGDERAYLAAANFFPYDTVLTPQAVSRRWQP